LASLTSPNGEELDQEKQQCFQHTLAYSATLDLHFLGTSRPVYFKDSND